MRISSLWICSDVVGKYNTVTQCCLLSTVNAVEASGPVCAEGIHTEQCSLMRQLRY